MKKYVIITLSLAISSLAFAQKKELKALEKAVKSGNFSTAKATLKSAESLLSAMDDKTKAKFYFLKGKTFYANGNSSDKELTEVVDAFNKVPDLERSVGKFIYGPQIKKLKTDIVSALYAKGEAAIAQKDFKTASSNMDTAYRISKDTIYLYNAAILAQNGQHYDETLKAYDELLDLGYTGIVNQYFATDIASGEEQSFPTRKLRDVSVKSKKFNNPRDSKTPSRVAEISKNIALIYVQQGQNDKAIEAINKAKSLNPNDYNLILSEANVRYKIGDKAEYKKLIEKAITLQPNNTDLIYNLGVVSGENKEYASAEKYYKKVLEIDPKHTNALIASAVLLINKQEVVVEQMNALGTSKADQIKFDDLNKQREQLFLTAIPYLEKALSIEPNNLDASKTLMGLYSAIDATEKFKVMKAKVEALEAGGN